MQQIRKSNRDLLIVKSVGSSAAISYEMAIKFVGICLKIVLGREVLALSPKALNRKSLDMNRSGCM
jgi:hypothetical protein